MKNSGENSLKLWQMGEQDLEIIVDTKAPIRLYEGFYSKYAWLSILINIFSFLLINFFEFFFF